MNRLSFIRRGSRHWALPPPPLYVLPARTFNRGRPSGSVLLFTIPFARIGQRGYKRFVPISGAIPPVFCTRKNGNTATDNHVYFSSCIPLFQGIFGHHDQNRHYAEKGYVNIVHIFRLQRRTKGEPSEAILFAIRRFPFRPRRNPAFGKSGPKERFDGISKNA